MGIDCQRYDDALEKWLRAIVSSLRCFCGRVFTFSRVAQFSFSFLALSVIACRVSAEENPVLFPEAHDPVLGDRAAVVEGASEVCGKS